MSVFETIQALLSNNAIDFEVSHHEPVYTSEEAARVRGTSLASGAKSLICKCDAEMKLFVMPADRRLSSKAIRRQFGWRKLRFANSEEVDQLTGLKPGSIPPFGKTGVNDKADNTAIMGPAGISHMTLRDLCVYVTEHLRGELGESKLLSAKTFQQLHKPELDDYACGWVRKKKSKKYPHMLYWHNGSNTMWYALVVFIPETRTVVAVTSNDGDIRKAEAAAWQIVERQMRGETQAYDKKSPFSGVRWSKDQPEVELDGEWLKLVSIDGLPFSKITEFSRQTYGELWRRRFEEDLVELLTRMGHAPKETVTLVVQPLKTTEKLVKEDVAMTESNRKAIRDKRVGQNK